MSFIFGEYSLPFGHMQSPCPRKEDCGSCGWSHIPYEKQLQQKLSDINGSFALNELDVKVTEILPSPKTSHYRNRMDFVINFEGLVGLRMKGKWWRVLDGHPCFIADERIEQHFYTVREWAQSCGLTFFDRKAHTGLLRYAVIRSTSTGETMITIVTSAPANDAEQQQTQAQLEKLAELTGATTLIWSINHTITDVSFGDEHHIISGEGVIKESINGFEYKISPNAFFQTNPHGAKLLMDAVTEFADPGSEKYKLALDLYCGSGFFTLPLTHTAEPTIGVEVNSEAIKDARINLELNNLQAEFHDVKTEDFPWTELGADLVLVDPPRSGMHDRALKDLLDAAPKTLIYVSCNYKHLARECKQLLTKYRLEAIKAVDMFPHTPHVETVAKFILK